jgi:hypothetical protein
VGSNVSRNGPVEPSLRAGLAMLIDTDARFPIDPSRLYATGFSGGARVACTVAQSFKVRIAGVIGCGAGFPAEAGPSAAAPFAFCGTVGNQDYNWTEMNELDRKLESLGLPHLTLRFEGRHAWPPKDTALAAIEWLELQAMASGTRPRDPDLIARLLEKELSQARSEEAGGALREAWSTYATAARTFKGLVDVSDLDSKAAMLKEKREVSDRLKREREEEEVERRRMSEIGALVDGLSDPDERFAKTTALYGLIASLKADERDARTPPQRNLARRLLEQVSITAYYAAQPLTDAKQYTAAIVYLAVQTEVHPESASLQYRIATLYARSGNKKKALEGLKAAAANGFSDASRIEREEAFNPLRDAARFRQLLDEIRGNQPKS